MFDLKVINSVLTELEEDRGIPKERIVEAIETALATAYKKEYGKRGQIIRAQFDIATGTVEFYQVKIVVDSSRVWTEEEYPEEAERPEDDERSRFDPEKHIFIEDAQKMKKGVELDDELTFPLETKDDFGRIAAQTAKQMIIQKIREAEKVSVLEEYGNRQGEVINGTVQRVERGNVYIDLGRAQAMMPYDEQIPGERYKTGDRIRGYLYNVDESPRGVFLRVSRSHPRFLEKLFSMEAPELANGTVEIRAIAREPGSRSKIAVVSHDEHIDPVGSLVGQRGVRVSTVTGELSGEKIDVIEWSEDPQEFIEEALSPAKVTNVETNEEGQTAVVEVIPDQQSLAIGRGGQNVRLAAKLTGWRIDIRSLEGEQIAEADEENVSVAEERKGSSAEESTTPEDASLELDEEVAEEKPDEEIPENTPEEQEEAMVAVEEDSEAKEKEETQGTDSDNEKKAE